MTQLFINDMLRCTLGPNEIILRLLCGGGFEHGSVRETTMRFGTVEECFEWVEEYAEDNFCGDYYNTDDKWNDKQVVGNCYIITRECLSNRSHESGQETYTTFILISQLLQKDSLDTFFENLNISK